MIEIDHSLLSENALENLIIDIITRQGTDYGEHEIAIEIKKKQLLNNLLSGKVVIVYCSQQECCDIINREDFLKFSQYV